MMGAAYGNYEFNETENQVIDKTAGRAKTWGIISIVVGALQMLIGMFGAFGNPALGGQFFSGLVALIVGISFVGAGNSLKSVVQTQGNDIPHMMQALQKMGSAFFLQIIVTIIGVVLVILVMILAVFVLAASAAMR